MPGKILSFCSVIKLLYESLLPSLSEYGPPGLNPLVACGRAIHVAGRSRVVVIVVVA